MRQAFEFSQVVREEFDAFIAQQEARCSGEEVLYVDLHCHDGNSDVPDERLGRILRCPETWTPTDMLLDCLGRNGTDVVTVTNHNNARSCYELQDRGLDVLTGAEFTCTFDKLDVRLHVLAYGFTPAQEARLCELRRDLPRFLDYTLENDLPTVLAHPLFFQSRLPPRFELIEHLTLMFDRFEVVNGQRETWQNLLVAHWLEQLDEERIERMAKGCDLPADRYCKEPYRKRMTGGSDDHMALFAGATGTRMWLPEESAFRADEPQSSRALEALRGGELAPVGTYVGNERLNVAMLDFFCQVAMNMRDPGLVRMLLHRGTAAEKLLAFAVANGTMELRRHRYTSRFLKAFHEALGGHRPGFVLRRMTARDYRPLVKELDRIALARSADQRTFEAQLSTSIDRMYETISELLATRVNRKIEAHRANDRDRPPADWSSPADALGSFELPVFMRGLFEEGSAREGMEGLAASLPSVIDGLPFPALAALVLGGAAFASQKVMYTNRPLLDEFAHRMSHLEHPRRVLWLTDTFSDRNGVASALGLLREEVARRDLPVDFLCAGNTDSRDDHLITVETRVRTCLPFYPEQPVRIVDIMKLQRIFVEGGYDRVVCSTEAPMGIIGLYLKQAFSVPAYFFLHTDWLDFAERKLGLDRQNMDRVRRLLRAFYRGFDGICVLNSQQARWLVSESMGLTAQRIHQTAHWPDPEFRPWPVDRAAVIPGVRPEDKVVLFAGRVSAEKGIFELPGLMERVRRSIPEARLVVAGSGPDAERLERQMGDAVFLGWLDKARLRRAYCAADVMVFPSRFDTFGNTVLEAMSCGLPVVAYREKGPADIIVDGSGGFLARDPEELAERTCRALTGAGRRRMRLEARRRASSYDKDDIIAGLMEFLGISRDRYTESARGAGSTPCRLPAAG